MFLVLKGLRVFLRSFEQFLCLEGGGGLERTDF